MVFKKSLVLVKLINCSQKNGTTLNLKLFKINFQSNLELKKSTQLQNMV